jgi:ribosomal protein S18 acetylase RimI-like enzyme
MTTLAPMSPLSFARYLESAPASYAQDNIAVNRWPALDAVQRARDDLAVALPLGLATPDNHLYDVMSELSADGQGCVVGMLWFAYEMKHGIRIAYVYDIDIYPPYRRQGHARRAFAQMELLALGQCVERIDLHVFAHNPAAQSLYRSLGYNVTGVNMSKTVAR